MPFLLSPFQLLVRGCRAGVVLAMLASAALAETFPARPVRIVVPFPLSGPADILGTARMSRSYRMIAQNAPPAISDRLANLAADAIRVDSRNVVILERKPGGVTTRGAEAVARATRDGYTLLLASNATMVLNPHFLSSLEYDPVRDFVLVAPLATMRFVLMSHAGMPTDTPEALVQWLKRRPGDIYYGSSGEGSTGHLAGELFRRATGISMIHVSFNGGAAALNGLATRQVSVAFLALPLALAYYPSGQFRPIAVTGSKRSERLPGVVSFGEAGLPSLDIEGWYGLFSPAAAPPAASAWLRERIVSAFSEPATRTQLEALGLEPVSLSIERFATRINTESEKWAPVLRASRLPQKNGES